MIRSAAKRLSSQKTNILRNIYFSKQLNASSTKDSTSKSNPVEDATKLEIERCYKNLGDLSFDNTQEAFKSKSNWELWRGLLVLKLCSYQTLVNQNVRLMNLGRKVLGQRLFEQLMRATFYGHFVVGQDQEEIKPKVKKLRVFGVKAILDYSVEADIASEASTDESIDGVTNRRDSVISARTYFYEGEPECDRNMEIFKDCIDAVAESTSSGSPGGLGGLAAIKITALCRPQLLLNLSDVLEKTQNFYKVLTKSSWSNVVDSQLSEKQFFDRLQEVGIKSELSELHEWFKEVDSDKDGNIDLYEWSRLLDHNIGFGNLFKIINLKTGKVESLIPNLTDREELEFRNLIRRFNELAKFADQKNVRMMIDAEQTYFQPAISRLTLEMMKKYNKNKAVLFNTYQAYLKSALNKVKIDLHIAKRDGFYFSAKLVRGAYMIQERKRAELMQYEDPINPDFKATSDMYHSCLKEIIEEVKQRPSGKVSVMCATHNEDTVRYAVRAMRENGIAPSQRIVCFGQLYGMCDQVSFSLGQAGYSVYKYVPYGPVDGVLPYLSRRVQENSSTVLQKSVRERKLMWKEIKRRYKNFQWIYNPLSHATKEKSTNEKNSNDKAFL